MNYKVSVTSMPHSMLLFSCFRTLFSCFRTSMPVLERPIHLEHPKKCWNNVNFQKLVKHNIYLHSNELLNLTVARKKKKLKKNLKKKVLKKNSRKIFKINFQKQFLKKKWKKSLKEKIQEKLWKKYILRQLTCKIHLRLMTTISICVKCHAQKVRQMPCTKSASSAMPKVICVKSHPALNFCASKGPASKATP